MVFNISNDILSIMALIFLDREEEIEKVEEKYRFDCIKRAYETNSFF